VDNSKPTIETGAPPRPPRFEVRVSNAAAMRLGLLLRVGLFFLMLPALVSAAEPDEGATIEYKVKAGFLYNFVKFVQWPDSALPSTNSPIVIGLLETDPAAPVLERAFQQKSVNGHALQVRRFRADEAPAGCHLFFLSRAERTRAGGVIERLKGLPVLTVSESDDFARSGGMINFVTKDENIRFEINLEAAERVGLQISSKLANMAILVRKPN
jgi:hypothetical protein